jgi:hypothetical protein
MKFRSLCYNDYGLIEEQAQRSTARSFPDTF